jgi:hypothetical protein
MTIPMQHGDEELAQAIADAVHCTGWLLNVALLGGIGILVAVLSAASDTVYWAWDWGVSKCGRKSVHPADGSNPRVVYSLLFAGPVEECSFNVCVIKVPGAEGQVVSPHRQYSLNLSGGYNEVATAGDSALSKWRPRCGCFRTEAGSETQIVPPEADRPTWLLSLCVPDASPDSVAEDDPEDTDSVDENLAVEADTSPSGGKPSPRVTRSMGIWFLGGPYAHEKDE